MVSDSESGYKIASKRDAKKTLYLKERSRLMRKRAKLKRKLSYPFLNTDQKGFIQQQLDLIEAEIQESHREEAEAEKTGVYRNTWKYKGAMCSIAKRAMIANKHKKQAMKDSESTSSGNLWNKCCICDVTFLSKQAYQIHISGMLHKKNTDAMKESDSGSRSRSYNQDRDEWDEGQRAEDQYDGPRSMLLDPKNANTLQKATELLSGAQSYPGHSSESSHSNRRDNPEDFECRMSKKMGGRDDYRSGRDDYRSGRDDRRSGRDDRRSNADYGRSGGDDRRSNADRGRQSRDDRRSGRDDQRSAMDDRRSGRNDRGSVREEYRPDDTSASKNITGMDLNPSMKEQYNRYCTDMATKVDYKCDVCMMACHVNNKERQLEIWITHMNGQQHASACDVQLAALGEEAFRKKFRDIPVVRLFVKDYNRKDVPKRDEYSSRGARDNIDNRYHSSNTSRSSDLYMPEEPLGDDIPALRSRMVPEPVDRPNIDPSTAENINQLIGVISKLKADQSVSSLTKDPTLLKTITEATNMLANLTKGKPPASSPSQGEFKRPLPVSKDDRWSSRDERDNQPRGNEPQSNRSSDFNQGYGRNDSLDHDEYFRTPPTQTQKVDEWSVPKKRNRPSRFSDIDEPVDQQSDDTFHADLAQMSKDYNNLKQMGQDPLKTTPQDREPHSARPQSGPNAFHNESRYDNRSRGGRDSNPSGGERGKLTNRREFNEENESNRNREQFEGGNNRYGRDRGTDNVEPSTRGNNRYQQDLRNDPKQEQSSRGLPRREPDSRDRESDRPSRHEQNPRDRDLRFNNDSRRDPARRDDRFSDRNVPDSGPRGQQNIDNDRSYNRDQQDDSWPPRNRRDASDRNNPQRDYHDQRDTREPNRNAGMRDDFRRDMQDHPPGGSRMQEFNQPPVNQLSILERMNIEERIIVASIGKICNEPRDAVVAQAVVDLQQNCPDMWQLFSNLLGLIVNASLGVQENQLVLGLIRQVFGLVVNTNPKVLNAQMMSITTQIRQAMQGIKNVAVLQNMQNPPQMTQQFPQHGDDNMPRGMKRDFRGHDMSSGGDGPMRGRGGKRARMNDGWQRGNRFN